MEKLKIIWKKSVCKVTYDSFTYKKNSYVMLNTSLNCAHQD